MTRRPPRPAGRIGLLLTFGVVSLISLCLASWNISRQQRSLEVIAPAAGDWRQSPSQRCRSEGGLLPRGPIQRLQRQYRCHNSLESAANPVGERLGKRAGETVWMEFGRLAKTLPDSVNLGQGYPDWDPPEFVRQSASEAISLGYNQYTRTQGHPDLVQVLAARYSSHFNRQVDPNSEIAVTVGCSQALYLALTALLQPQDEVLLIEPFFDLYLGQVKLAGGKPVSVPLSLNEEGKWNLDLQKLESAITPRTKALILNTPHNPTGKVFSLEEMEGIAAVLRRHPQVSVISDEVYKYIINTRDDEQKTETANGLHVASPPKQHVHFASLPGMWERTVTCSSAGKTFSITGWQVGWLVGPRDFVSRVHDLLPHVQFCAPTPMQHALAQVLADADKPFNEFDTYYAWLRDMYQAKRRLLVSGLERGGFEPTNGEGGFFVMADAKRLLPLVPQSYLDEAAARDKARDFAVCRWLAEEYGIVTIPGSPFFSSEAMEQLEKADRCLVRLAFCKRDEVLHHACERLGKLGDALAAAGLDETVGGSSLLDSGSVVVSEQTL